jgi:hypothetical protein
VTLATASMTGLPSCQTPFDLPLPGFIQVPGPHAYAANREKDPDGYGAWCIEQTERVIQREGENRLVRHCEPRSSGGLIACARRRASGGSSRGLRREVGAARRGQRFDDPGGRWLT